MFGILLFVALQSSQAEREFQQLQRETEALKRAVELAKSPQGQMCESYVGRTIKPVTFDAAAAKFPAVSPKGEYEKTEAYE